MERARPMELSAPREQPAVVARSDAGPFRVAVVVPCHRAAAYVLDVLARMPGEAAAVYVVDDACPEKTGDLVERECPDPRVVVLRHERNGGVGAAVKTGYRRALADGMDVVVKIDGDGQMAPELVPAFLGPLLGGVADYVKGNRFYNVEDVRGMPTLRLVGNAVLSFMTKLSTGYWRLFDPTNGFTAIHRAALAQLPLDKLDDRYFFESDMLFRLATIRAVVIDLPMRAAYGSEKSGLRVRSVLGRFARGHLVNFAKRVFYSYFLRDFSVASVELVVGMALVLFAGVFGSYKWITSVESGVATTAGGVMLAALPAILGVQLLLSFLAADMAHEPTRPLQGLLGAAAAPPVPAATRTPG